MSQHRSTLLVVLVLVGASLLLTACETPNPFKSENYVVLYSIRNPGASLAQTAYAPGNYTILNTTLDADLSDTFLPWRVQFVQNPFELGQATTVVPNALPFEQTLYLYAPTPQNYSQGLSLMTLDEFMTTDFLETSYQLISHITNETVGAVHDGPPFTPSSITVSGDPSLGYARTRESYVTAGYLYPPPLTYAYGYPDVNTVGYENSSYFQQYNGTSLAIYNNSNLVGVSAPNITVEGSDYGIFRGPDGFGALTGTDNYTVIYTIPFVPGSLALTIVNATFSLGRSDVDPPRMVNLSYPLRYDGTNPVTVSFFAQDSVAVSRAIVWSRNVTGDWILIHNETLGGNATVTVSFVPTDVKTDLRILLIDSSNNTQMYTMQPVFFRERPLVVSVTASAPRAQSLFTASGSIRNSSNGAIPYLRVSLVVDDAVIARTATNSTGNFVLAAFLPDITNASVVRLDYGPAGQYANASTVLTTPAPLTRDLGVTAITAPIPALAGNVTFNVSVQNFGTANASSRVALELFTQDWAGSLTLQIVCNATVSLAPASAMNMSIDCPAQAGTYLVRARLTNGSDENVFNNQRNTTFSVFDLYGYSFYSSSGAFFNGTAGNVTLTVSNTGIRSLANISYVIASADNATASQTVLASGTIVTTPLTIGTSRSFDIPIVMLSDKPDLAYKLLYVNLSHVQAGSVSDVEWVPVYPAVALYQAQLFYNGSEVYQLHGLVDHDYNISVVVTNVGPVTGGQYRLNAYDTNGSLLLSSLYAGLAPQANRTVNVTVRQHSKKFWENAPAFVQVTSLETISGETVWQYLYLLAASNGNDYSLRPSPPTVVTANVSFSADTCVDTVGVVGGDFSGALPSASLNVSINGVVVNSSDASGTPFWDSVGPFWSGCGDILIPAPASPGFYNLTFNLTSAGDVDLSDNVFSQTIEVRSPTARTIAVTGSGNATLSMQVNGSAETVALRSPSVVTRGIVGNGASTVQINRSDGSTYSYEFATASLPPAAMSYYENLTLRDNSRTLYFVSGATLDGAVPTTYSGYISPAAFAAAGLSATSLQLMRCAGFSFATKSCPDGWTVVQPVTQTAYGLFLYAYGGGGEAYALAIPRAFGDGSTNVSAVPLGNASNYSGLTLNQPAVASLHFTAAVNLTRFTSNTSLLEDNVIIEPLRIKVFDTITELASRPAILTFYGVNFTQPFVLRNGGLCSEAICSSFDYQPDDGIFTLSVTGFSEYQIIEEPICSNHVCEATESCTSCPVDCGVCRSPGGGGGGGGSGGGGGGSGGSSSGGGAYFATKGTAVNGSQANNKTVTSCTAAYNCSVSDCAGGSQVERCVDAACGGPVKTTVHSCGPVATGATAAPVVSPPSEQSVSPRALVLFLVLVFVVLLGAVSVFFLRKRMMHPKAPHLHDVHADGISAGQRYVQSRRANGMSDEDIRESLELNGWQESDIDAVLKE